MTVLTITSLDWGFRMQTLPHVEELSPAERIGFDSYVRIQYSGGVGGFIYDNFLRHISSPEAIRYVDRLREQPS